VMMFLCHSSTIQFAKLGGVCVCVYIYVHVGLSGTRTGEGGGNTVSCW
jgi:hypothetical protein